ncbi:MAG: hypothetical protein G01um101413_932, partial [Parcubacteria group bacterium Gr01-1014_13]
ANDLDLNFNSIINVATIIGKDNKWRIDEDGNLIQKIATEKGDKEIYGLQSSGKQEIVISGTSTLENGTKKVILAELDQAIIDTTVPLKIFFSLSGQTKEVYVSERSHNSFVLKEKENGQSNAEFDWRVIAKILSSTPAESETQTSEVAQAPAVAPNQSVPLSIPDTLEQEATSTLDPVPAMVVLEESVSEITTSTEAIPENASSTIAVEQ